MTERPPDSDLSERETFPVDDRDPLEPEPASLPRWVAVLIGVVLVTLAGLAVFTGLRYRDDGTIMRHVPARQERAMAPAAPGEPGAGGSLVLHGREGANVPAANEAVTGASRAVVEGGPAGVASTVRIWARRGMIVDVTPGESMIYVNGMPIGHARQFDTMDEVYDFPEPGSYNVRVVSPAGRERRFVVTAGDDAQHEIAKVTARLEN